MKKTFLALLLTVAVSLQLPAKILYYQLQSDSTITPHDGAAPTGPAQPLIGSFIWTLVTPSGIPGSQEFVLTNLNLFSSSNSVTLDASAQPNSTIENPPGHAAALDALVDVSSDATNGYALVDLGGGIYAGPDTAPTNLRLNVSLTPTNGDPVTAYLFIHAKLVAQPTLLAFTNLASFAGTNGSVSEGKLVRGPDGSFYGTTLQGGSNNLGGVFKLTPTNKITEAISFKGTNGSGPQAGLILGKDGNLYGTAALGGKFNMGTVFRLTPKGVLTNLLTFNSANGDSPAAALELGKDGNFYGTTYYGGLFDKGTVFRLTPKGVLTTLVSFSGNNGSHPQASLVQGTDGNFYGTTADGGGFFTGDPFSGWGTVFKVKVSGNTGLITVLASFSGIDGAEPLAALTVGANNTLYGTTSSGGNGFEHTPYTGDGTIFKIGQNGGLVTIHYFSEAVNGGIQPEFSQLVLNANGNFYGTTFAGGQFGGGTIYQMTASGIVQTLVSFQDSTGTGPWAGLTPGEASTIYYGTTSTGGKYDQGTAFRLNLPNR